MPSLATREAPTRRGITDLLVLWQNPQDREIIPVGRLSHAADEYVFRYTAAARAAAAVDRFGRIPGFDDLDAMYASAELPPIFTRRVMPPERPDYAAYVASLGLDVSATPWEQIVASGGQREGDTLQLMELPCVTDGRARARFFVNGIRHVAAGGSWQAAHRRLLVTPDEHESELQRVSVGSTLWAVPESNNSQDPSAMLVVSAADTPLGWVPRALSSSIREIANGGSVPLTVVRVGQAASVPHQRLVVALDVAVPGEFQFDREGHWDSAEQS
ncbi:MAG: hypothetical protein ACK5OX_07005 [Desertimonas sp.]